MVWYLTSLIAFVSEIVGEVTNSVQNAVFETLLCLANGVRYSVNNKPEIFFS